MNPVPAKSHTPRPGRRTLMLQFTKFMQEHRGILTMEILPPLTEQEYDQIHYTQRYINSTFSNYTGMNVFETYFAVKFTFMRVTELPPIRVFKADSQLWCVDNRRLWVMKQAKKFHCEGPFTKEQSTSYFQELEMKRRSLRGGSGVHVQFHNDPSHVCCITAFNQGLLDKHFAEVHLKISLENIRNLATITYSNNLTINEDSSLRSRVQRRYELLKRAIEIDHILPTEKMHQILLAFNNRNLMSEE